MMKKCMCVLASSIFPSYALLSDPPPGIAARLLLSSIRLFCPFSHRMDILSYGCIDQRRHNIDTQ